MAENKLFGLFNKFKTASMKLSAEDRKVLTKQLNEASNSDELVQVSKTNNQKGDFVKKVFGGGVSADSDGFLEEQDFVTNFVGKDTSNFIISITGDFSFREADIDEGMDIS